MQTSKISLALGTFMVVVLPVLAGPDTAEQAKMREVLRRMMEQSPAESGPAAKTVPPPPTPAPKPAPTKVTPAQPATAAPAPTKPPVVPAAPVAATAAPVVVPKTQVVPVPATVGQPTFQAVPPPDDKESLARARAVLRQKMEELNATPVAPTAPVATTPVVPPAPAKPVAPVAPVAPPAAPIASSGAPGSTVIQAPDSPLSSSKQSRLAELLAQYRADTITAQEYHTQRAAIIAEP